MLDGGGGGLHNRVDEPVRSTREGEGAMTMAWVASLRV